VQLNALAATAVLTLHLQQLLLLSLATVIGRRVVQFAFARAFQHLLPVQQEVAASPERLEEGPAVGRTTSARRFRR